MSEHDPDRLLAHLRDPNVESAEIAASIGVPREEAGRAARLVLAIGRARAEEAATLPAPLAAAVLRAAELAERVDLVAALAARPEKSVAKEAKRTLHRLRLRGVAVPDAPRPPPPAAASLPAEPPPAAYASTVDAHGERAIWLPRGLPGKGLEVAQAVVSDERGLVELRLGMLGRKEWRAFVKGLLERAATMGVAEIDRGRAHALLAAARARGEACGTRAPDGADHWLAQLGAPPPLPPPGEALPPLDGEAAEAALAASGDLHDLPLLRGWLADEPFLRELAKALDDAGRAASEEVAEAKRARERALMGEAVARYLTPARRERLSARLLEVAEHLHGAGDEARARAAAAAARAVAAGRPCAEIPFARRLVEKAFPEGGAAASAPDPGGRAV